MMNIFKYEFKMYTKSILVWGVSVIGVILMMMSIYPTFGSDAVMMEKILANYPEEMLKAFGMDSGLPLSSVLGYLVFIFPFVQLCLAIQASNYGFSILSIEEREFTADYLMSKPVSRMAILNAKFASAFVALLITNIVTWVTMILSIELFRNDNTYELKNLLILLSSIVLFQLFFLAIGMVVSVLTKRIRSVLTFSLGLSFGTYIINAMGLVLGGETLSYFSPFAYFEVGHLLEFGVFDFKMTMISVVITLISLGTTYVLYPKRDIQSL